MKKVIRQVLVGMLIGMLLVLTGCIEKWDTGDKYDEMTKSYLETSREFNKEFLKVNQDIKVDETLTWNQVCEKIPYIADTSNVMRCPEYSIKTGGANCSGYAYLTTRYEELQFAYFAIVRSKKQKVGHMLACYYQDGALRIYSNSAYTDNVMLDQYLQERSSEKLYVAIVSKDLNFIKSYEVDCN